MASDGFAEKIHHVLPRIRGRREEIEDARRIPKDLIEELTATGIFRLGVPAALGGDEADPLDIMRVIETIAAADGSVGWCAMIAIDAGIIAGMMPESGVGEVYADMAHPKSQVVAPMGVAVRVDGGVVVNGRWTFASGITHADWILAGCVLLYEGQPRMTPIGLPELVHVWLPVQDVEVHDTWYVNGLRGTASNDISLTDVFVPERRTLAFFDQSTHRPEPLVQMPLAAAFAARVSCVAVGIARAALDELTALASDKMPTLSSSRLAEKPVFQVELARAEGALMGARSYLYDSVDDAWQTLLAGRTPTVQQVAACRIAALHAVEVAATVAHRASTLAGGTSVYTTSSLQRHARDADAVGHHFILSPNVWENAGRVLVGMDPGTPVF